MCCQQVVKDGALPVIFKVIKKCNRSLPHLEVIKYSISILFNVGKVSWFSSIFIPFCCVDEDTNNTKPSISILRLLSLNSGVYNEKGKIYNPAMNTLLKMVYIS